MTLPLATITIIAYEAGAKDISHSDNITRYGIHFRKCTNINRVLHLYCNIAEILLVMVLT